VLHDGGQIAGMVNGGSTIMNSQPEKDAPAPDEPAEVGSCQDPPPNVQPGSQGNLAQVVPGRVSGEEMEVVARVIDAVRYVVLVVSLTIWSVLGFMFWIPMLVYTITHFSACIVYVTITEDDPRVLGVRLERAVRFYLQGFRNVIQAVYSPSQGRAPAVDMRIDVPTIVLHVLGTVVFWGVVAVAVLYLAGTFGGL